MDDDFKRVIGIRFVNIFLAIKSMVFNNNMDSLPVTFPSPFVLFPLKTPAYNFLPNTQVVALFAVLLCELLPWDLCLSICIVSLHYSMSYSWVYFCFSWYSISDIFSFIGCIYVWAEWHSYFWFSFVPLAVSARKC